MSKYRNILVIVDAFQMTKTHFDLLTWPDWLVDAWSKGKYEGGMWYEKIIHLRENRFVVEIEAGACIVNWGDFIIKDVQDNFHVCDPAHFKKTYEKIEKGENQNARNH